MADESAAAEAAASKDVVAGPAIQQRHAISSSGASAPLKTCSDESGSPTAGAIESGGGDGRGDGAVPTSGYNSKKKFKSSSSSSSESAKEKLIKEVSNRQICSQPEGSYEFEMSGPRRRIL